MDVDSESVDEESILSDPRLGGYCIFNDSGRNSVFRITIFDYELELNQDPNSNVGHGAVVWESSVIFAKYMEFNTSRFGSDYLKNKKVLEFGSGCGLAGMCFMIRGSIVTFTDLPAVIETLTTANVQRIFAQITTGTFGCAVSGLHRPSVLALDWTEDLKPPPLGPEPPYDILLLTDCVFSVDLALHLVAKMRQCCGPRTEIICVHEVRDVDANAKFLEELGKYFSWKRLAKSRLHPDYRSAAVDIITAKPIRKHLLV